MGTRKSDYPSYFSWQNAQFDDRNETPRQNFDSVKKGLSQFWGHANLAITIYGVLLIYQKGNNILKRK
jgi:hypothetical protein